MGQSLGRAPARAAIQSADINDGIITSAHIAADSIVAADIASDAITLLEIADDAVGVAELSATGTASTSTFLRGDNSWYAVDTEGTGIKSTGESGGTKFLREDGDGTSSWQTAGSPSITDGGNATAITIDSSEDCTFTGHQFPAVDNSKDLGSTSKRWRNIYTNDIHLANDRGNWTVIEEEDYLTLRNNKTDKVYKLVMEEIE